MFTHCLHPSVDAQQAIVPFFAFTSLLPSSATVRTLKNVDDVVAAHLAAQSETSIFRLSFENNLS
jgi:hypothetical protein